MGTLYSTNPSATVTLTEMSGCSETISVNYAINDTISFVSATINAGVTYNGNMVAEETKTVSAQYDGFGMNASWPVEWGNVLSGCIPWATVDLFGASTENYTVTIYPGNLTLQNGQTNGFTIVVDPV